KEGSCLMKNKLRIHIVRFCSSIDCFFFSSRRRHTRSKRDWSSDVCSSDLYPVADHQVGLGPLEHRHTPRGCRSPRHSVSPRRRAGIPIRDLGEPRGPRPGSGTLRGMSTPTANPGPRAGHARAGRRQLGRVGLWTGSLEGVRAAEIPDLLADLEAQGWPTLWFGEAVGREAFTAAQLYLSATERMVIGTGIANIYGRD